MHGAVTDVFSCSVRHGTIRVNVQIACASSDAITDIIRRKTLNTLPFEPVRGASLDSYCYGVVLTHSVRFSLGLRCDENTCLSMDRRYTSIGSTRYIYIRKHF